MRVSNSDKDDENERGERKKGWCVNELHSEENIERILRVDKSKICVT